MRSRQFQPPGVRPTPYHRRFVTTGRSFDRLATPLVDLDLPDAMVIPTDRPVLFAGNHRSLFDFIVTMIVFSRFGMSSRLLIRADLVDRGLSGHLLRNIGSIAASRDKREHAESEAVAALRRRELVAIMPEGRVVPPEDRTHGGVVGPVRPGLSRIARAAGAAVIPVAFHGTDKVWPRDGAPVPQWPRPTVRLRLGDAHEMVGDDDQANSEAFMADLGRLVASLSDDDR